jgi:hypothetical protein
MPHPTGIEFNKLLQGSGIILNKDGTMYFIPSKKLAAFKMPPSFQNSAEELDSDGFAPEGSGGSGAAFKKGAVYRGLEAIGGLDGVSMAIALNMASAFGADGKKVSRTARNSEAVFKFNNDNKIIADLTKGGKPSND